MTGDELPPIAFEEAGLEFGGRGVDGFEKNGGDAGESRGALGVEAAFGDGAEGAGTTAGVRWRERNRRTGFAYISGSFVDFADVRELAIVMEAIWCLSGTLRHGAASAIGKSESAQGVAVFGFSGSVPGLRRKAGRERQDVVEEITLK
jgi:hypothetical protein